MAMHAGTTRHQAVRRTRSADRRRGNTLLEIVVVIGVIVLLLAILAPSLSGARERARRMICQGNLRQWGIAFQMYRDDHGDYLPTEGTHGTGENTGVNKPGTWYNELPPYLDIPAYKDVEGVNEAIETFPAMHVWICPSKNLTDAYRSDSGKNQFHYGMNQVLDGMGTAPEGSVDTPGFPDQGERPLRAVQFIRTPYTVLMFDIGPNSMRGSPRDVATMYWRNPWNADGARGRFHGDYANFLYLDGSGDHFVADDLVTDHDFINGAIVWDHPRLYWGYRPPGG